MGAGNFTDDFKRDAVAQITERGYRVAEVSKRLSVSQHSLYAWRRKLSKPSGPADVDQAAEIRRLKRDLARVTKERDILKKPPRISPRMQSEIRVRCPASPAVHCSSDVSLPTHPTQRFLRLAEDPLEQARSGGCPSERPHQQGLE